MLQKQKILILSAALCVAAAWYVRSQDASFTYAPIITASVVVVTVYVYYVTVNPTGGCKSTSVDSKTGKITDTGSCNLDSDCNAPHGQCWKNAQGQCGCVCSDGYSGPDCKTQGIPWNSPSCMGPNTQWPARKDKNGMCVCPPGHWASGTDSKYGFVQCLKCDGNYGPLAGDAPCTYQWGQQQVLSNACIDNQNTNNPSWCSEFSSATQNPPPGKTGSIISLEQCGVGAPEAPNSCRCAQPSGRAVCQINGWVENNGASTNCAADGIPRSCSSYTCK